MWAQSAGGEDDAGTLYPMYFYDTNGNYIEMHYRPGSGSGTADTSARISYVQDARAGFPYSFAYNSDPIPHLTGLINYLPTTENYSFTYLGNQQLFSPYDNTPFGTVTQLSAVTTTGLNIATSFQYALSTGEMTAMTTPLGGSIGWGYRTYTYSGTRRYREVQTRTVTPQSGAAPWSWNIVLDNGANLHGSASVDDLGAGSHKVWTFDSSGRAVTYEERGPTTTLLHKDYTWTTDSAGTPYVGSVVTTVDPGTAYAVQTKSTQTLDIFGNIKASAVYDYGNLTTAARTYNYNYLHEGNANYANRYIRNRVSSVTVTPAGGTATTLVQNSYDGYCTATNCGTPPYIAMPVSYASMHDPSYDVNFFYRGNLMISTQLGGLGGSVTTGYQDSGVAFQTTDSSGHTVTSTPSASTNYSLPGLLTPGGNSNLATSISYNSSWAVTGVTGPNGANSQTQYDTYGRPYSSTSPDGAVTSYTYTYLPNTQTATVNSKWKRTTLDGFGRTIKEETGHDSTTVSVVDTQYAPCACSPLAKLWRVSRPYAPGGTPLWTTYAYDGTGRTVSITIPDGSVTNTLYQGNTTKVTDPAGKWKKQTTDAMGNLVMVTEPNPAGGADWTTSYTYNFLNQLTQVSMPRSGYTQIRTFTWSGSNLASETTPEAGTVTYQYDASHHVTQRTDAKGQQTQYSYDAYGRLAQVRHYIPSTSWPYNQEQVNQRVDYSYDTPADSSFQNTWGRLAAVQFHNESAGSGEQFSYQYSYSTAGRVLKQRLQVTPTSYPTHVTNQPVNFDVAYTWDNEGKMTSQQYPGDDAAHTYNYQFDAMARPASMGITGAPSIATAAWAGTGELSSFNGDARTYNSLGQLTRITAAGMMDMEYRYTAGQNNGRIWQSKDWITGEEVTYGYDAVNRLIAASTTDASWGQAYTYDGFGNLTGKGGDEGERAVVQRVDRPDDQSRAEPCDDAGRIHGQ